MAAMLNKSKKHKNRCHKTETSSREHTQTEHEAIVKNELWLQVLYGQREGWVERRWPIGGGLMCLAY